VPHGRNLRGAGLVMMLAAITASSQQQPTSLSHRLNHPQPRAGSWVVRIQPLHFPARRRKTLLNQALSVLYLSMFYCVVVY